METSSQKKIHWLRLWTKGWLEGSIRFDLTPAQRSVFIDLCAMARQSRNPPMVQANETTPYPHSWLANKLNIPLELLEDTLKLCEAQERIYENNSGIKIIKFEEYQAPMGKQGQSQGGKKGLTPAEVRDANKDNSYRIGMRKEIKRYKEEHDGGYPVGDALQAIEDRLNAEIYGEQGKMK